MFSSSSSTFKKARHFCIPILKQLVAEGQSKEELEAAIQNTCSLFRTLILIINKQKPFLILPQKIPFIGAILKGLSTGTEVFENNGFCTFTDDTASSNDRVFSEAAGILVIDNICNPLCQTQNETSLALGSEELQSHYRQHAEEDYNTSRIISSLTW